ncbi:hypothetical protein AB0D97_03500, partial [Streptomyces roseus]
RLSELFEQARVRRQAAAPLAAIGPAGVGGVAWPPVAVPHRLAPASVLEEAGFLYTSYRRI